MNEFKKQINLFIPYAESILENISEDTKSDQKLQLRNVTLNQYLELKNVLYGCSANDDLIKDFIFPESAKMGTINHNINFFNSNVRNNPAQKDAVEKFLAMQNILIIQGPPGTGKTSVITEMIMQALNKNPRSRIMITSSAHVAVNNVIDKLISSKLPNIARIKNKDDAEQKYKDLDFEYILETYKSTINLRNKKYSDNIVELIDKNKTQLMHSAITSQNVLGVTINAIHGCHFGYSDQFDYIFVDEVGKSHLLELLSVLPHAKKLILIGDPKQLPPSIEDHDLITKLSVEEYNYLLEKPYINHLFSQINENCKAFLNSQFRMVQPIGSYISDTFYEHKLKNGRKDINLNSINFITYKVNDKNRVSGKPLKNFDEYEILESQLDKLEELEGRKRSDKKINVAIITFYRDQINLLKANIRRYENFNIQIDTIDAFQGKDAEIVYLLTVRNSDAPTSFITKPNRLNVAVSRAANEMWIIGNIDYLRKVSYLRDYISFYKTYGKDEVKCHIYQYENNRLIPYKQKRQLP